MTTIVNGSAPEKIATMKVANHSHVTRVPWPPVATGTFYGDSVFIGKNRVAYLRIGREVFGFRTETAPIGKGGMGSVRIGYNLRNNEKVAIKRINPRLANIPAVKKYAENEACLIFAHPNLVEMIGCCVSKTPKPVIFIVSRFVVGQDIDKYVNDSFEPGPRRTRHVGIMMSQVAEALDFIHDKGIIHMDLKPANIMVENGSNIKLMDLGIASTAAERAFSSSGLVGTPGYAAPEQYVTEERLKLKVDRRADVYGMAATFYAILSEKRPGANIDYNVPGIGKRLRYELRKGMSSDPDHRHSTAGEFAAACNKAIKRDQGFSKNKGLYIGVSVFVVAAIAALLSLLIL